MMRLLNHSSRRPHVNTDKTDWVTPDWDGDVAAAVRCELLLLDPRTRATRSAVLELLHPDFIEFGSSGRVWNRSDEVVGLEQNPGMRLPEARNIRAAHLGRDAVWVPKNSSCGCRRRVRVFVAMVDVAR
jgi:hypothetical protein